MDKVAEDRKVRCYDAFQACTTVEGLRVVAETLSLIIKKLSPKDKEWLRDIYESKKFVLENPGLSQEEVDKLVEKTKKAEEKNGSK